MSNVIPVARSATFQRLATHPVSGRAKRRSQDDRPFGLPGGPLRRRNVQLWQQNTATRRLTEEMLDAVFWRARELLDNSG
jgi:hypothetical protein